MPRKFFKKMMPDPHEIHKNRLMSIFGKALHNPNLWHLNRRSVAGAIGVGFFFMWWPIPIQMYLAAAAAIVMKHNLPLCVATVWITNPLTMGPMFYFAYTVGTWLVGVPKLDFEFQFTLEWLLSMNAIWPPLLVGCLFLAIVNGLIGYFGINAIWRYSVMKRRSDKTRGDF